ncbi:MAG: hypothetical protein KDA93_03115 [Planctomycetaceae bacterium]|nr:hypothetical protein [Planctomycetaceae bacterium]
MATSQSSLTPEQLQQMLSEKDQLIQALTGRLEGAAEQLDRLKRSGADRGMRISGGGVSPELQEQQRTILESLSETVERWEEMQPCETLDRLELKLDDLRTMVQSALDSGITVGSSSAPAPSITKPASPSSQGGGSKSSGGEKPKADALSGWEAMKAQLMSGGDAPAAAPTSSPQEKTKAAALPPSPAPPTSPAIDQSAQSPQPPAAESVTTFTPTPVEDVPGPDPVDFTIAGKSDLISAVEARDEYIGYLTRRLRSEEQRTRPTIDWATLNNAPEDLKKILNDLEADLMERLRIAEVDLSLERAKLARIRANVEATQRKVEQQIQSRGNGRAKPPANSADTPPPTDEKSPKKWLNSLGLG